MRNPPGSATLAGAAGGAFVPRRRVDDGFGHFRPLGSQESHR
jgi:hypothetical protein